MSKRLLRVLVLVVSSVPGVAAGCDARKAEPGYSIGFYNDTDATLTNTRADWHANGAAHHEEAGFLSPHAEKASDGEPQPIPEKANINWKTADGKVHSREVEIAKLIANPRQFSGTIYFKFTADGGVTVVPLTYADERKAAEHGKSALQESR